jgi:hypothetical protein
MDLMQARLDLARAVQDASAAPAGVERLGASAGNRLEVSAGNRLGPVRQWLVTCGATALGLDPAATPDIAALVEHAARAPASPARRAFAVLLVDALGVPGLLAVRSSQARLGRATQALLESALPDVLLRAGYPFGADLEARRKALARLPTSIDEHLRPPEPSIPTWLSGRVDY